MADGSKTKIKPVALSDFDAEIARRLRLRCQASFRDFVTATYVNLSPNWHVDDLCWHLQEFAEAVERGESPRLMITLPPRHTKSTLASQRFPVWGMGKYQWEVILATYGQDLANDHSRDAREIARSEIVREIFPDIAPQKPESSKYYADYKRADVDQVRAWTTGATKIDGFDQRGRYKAVGVGGPLTGKGGNVLIIDDPHKDRADADSQASRDGVWHWYTSTAYTRLTPGGGVLCIQTRWHEDDLAGRLLARSADGSGDKWKLVNFPAIAEEDEYGPQGQLRRRTGEALDAKRYPLEFLNRVCVQNPRDFASLYQQRPVPLEGGLIKPAYLAHTYKPLAWGGFRAPDRVSQNSPLLGVPGIARGGFRIVGADTATKAGQLNDFTVIGTSVTIDQLTYIADITHRRLEFPELCDMMQSICERDDPHVVLIEDKGSGQSLIQQLPKRRNAKGEILWRWPIVAVVPTQDKHTRMSNETPALEAGRVLLPESAVWKPEFERELLLFPSAAHDDQVDYLSQLLWYLRTSGRSSGVNSLFEW